MFKKGDMNNPSNYRGISRCDTSSKLYGTLLLITDYGNGSNKIILLGSIKPSSKEDILQLTICLLYWHVFRSSLLRTENSMLLLLISKRRLILLKTFVFVFLLWPILLQNGIKGKLFRCIKSMYSNVKARVRCGDKLTDYVNCTAGVKQGDVCSPILFSLFINELALQVIDKGRYGACCMIDAFGLFILLLADDVILMSETVVGL